MTGEPGRQRRRKYVLFDVDGTLIDAVRNQRRVRGTWAERYGLDADEVYQVALRTRPRETFTQVAADQDPHECLAPLHEPVSLREAVPHLLAFVSGPYGDAAA